MNGVVGRNGVCGKKGRGVTARGAAPPPLSSYGAHTHRCIGGRCKLIRRHDRDLVEVSCHRCRAQWFLGAWEGVAGACDDEGLGLACV